MHQGKLVFSQVMAHLPLTTFRRCVAKHQGHFKVKGFSCLDHFLSMAFAQLTWRESLRDIARPLYTNDPMGVDLDATVYAFDATTIDLCLSVYPWAPFRQAKAAIKLHTLLELRGAIQNFIHITDGRTHEVNVLDDLPVEPGA